MRKICHKICNVIGICVLKVNCFLKLLDLVVKMAAGGNNGNDMDKLMQSLQEVHLDIMDESDDYV